MLTQPAPVEKDEFLSLSKIASAFRNSFDAIHALAQSGTIIRCIGQNLERLPDAREGYLMAHWSEDQLVYSHWYSDANAVIAAYALAYLNVKGVMPDILQIKTATGGEMTYLNENWATSSEPAYKARWNGYDRYAFFEYDPDFKSIHSKGLTKHGTQTHKE